MSRAGLAVPRRSIRAALAGASFVFLTASLMGVLADEAAPGQLLYRIDRAAEVVGVGRGEARERLTEALKLMEKGDTGGAVLIAAEAVRQIRPGLTFEVAGAEPSVKQAVEVAPVDPAESARVIKLAVEALLRSLETDDKTVDSAVNGLVAVLAPPGGGDPAVAVSTSSTTSSTTTSSTTTSSTTSTSTSTTSTTTPTSSTQPSESTTTTTTGGIILPPLP